MSWSTANHEVIPMQEFLLPEITMHPYLWAFLECDGETFKESVDDYDALRKKLSVAIFRFHGRPTRGKSPTENVKASRLRTWKPLFERAGLITVNSSSILEVSPFGNAVRSLFDDLANRICGANEHLSQWAITVLNRYPLLNPLEGPNGGDGPYPTDSDILPFRAIWLAARHLENRLHWQELNHGLMLLHYQRDIHPLIERINAARVKGGDEYFKNPSSWLGNIGAVNDGAQTRRRITPWLSRASFGGLLAEEDEESGLWTLRSDKIELIDNALSEHVAVPSEVLLDRANFIRWLSAPISKKSFLVSNTEDRVLLDNSLQLVKKFGQSKIICLSGLPGTGKSRLSRMIAEELTDGDPYRMAEIQFHESTGYEDFVEGFVPRADGTGFILKDKTLRMICKRAESDPQHRDYVLVIEEFTRANTHAVLGELLTYIEHRERKFRFVTSQDEASIPANLVIIATMNPRDRSATQLDAAVRRRMHYIDVPPSADALRSMLETKIPDSLLTDILVWYQKWHTQLPFGHGVFSEAATESDVKEIWQGTCLRLLENALGDIDEVYSEAVQEFPCTENSL